MTDAKMEIMTLGELKEEIADASKCIGDSAEVYVRVHKTSTCVSPRWIFVDEDGVLQIVLPSDCKIGK